MARNPFAVAAQRIQPAPTIRASYYRGAAHDRLNQDWLMSSLSQNQVMRWALQTLRDRGRDLVMNNGSAAAVPATFAENVIGKDGITLQARVSNGAGGIDQATGKLIETAWYRWCEPQHCTVDRRGAFIDVETMIASNECTEGEILIRLVRGFPNNPFRFALEVLDPDQLDHTYNRLAAPGQREIIMGVEVDEWGAPVTYHLWRNHPSEPKGRERVPVPADDIIHLFVQWRARQARGVTWFAPVVTDLQMLGGYREAELVAARTAAAKQGFISQDPEYSGDVLQAPGEPTKAVPMDAAPGSIDQLPPGFKFFAWDPQHPNAVFADFDKAILHTIASALRISYMSLSGDMSDTSYSSGRIGMLAERAVYQKLQQRLIRHVHGRIYREWLKMALLSGQLRLDTFASQRFADAATWRPRSFPWIDPAKDLEAAQKEVAMGINTLTNLNAERGRDFEEVMQERAHELAIAKKYGVPLGQDQYIESFGAAPSPAQQTGAGAPADQDSPAARTPVRLLRDGTGA